MSTLQAIKKISQQFKSYKIALKFFKKIALKCFKTLEIGYGFFQCQNLKVNTFRYNLYMLVNDQYERLIYSGTLRDVFSKNFGVIVFS